MAGIPLGVSGIPLGVVATVTEDGTSSECVAACRLHTLVSYLLLVKLYVDAFSLRDIIIVFARQINE